ncbi:MAG TPA: DinB family protein [Flavitalea sp.]|nr:DinB family protein [Flavitalea sp.]
MVPQTLWLDRTWTFNFDSGMFPIIYNRLQGTVPRLYQLFENCEDEKAAMNTRGWTAKEHVGHLADLEDLWWNRWEDYKNNKEILTAADITNRKTTEAGHNSKSIEALLNSFTEKREKILNAIYECDEKLLLRTSLHPRLKTQMRLVDYLYFVAEHDDHHLTAIMFLF